MVKEKYVVQTREINLSVTNGEITTVINKNITKSACRVYENGCIGVAGKLGGADEELMEQAVKNLKLGIPYPAEATAGSVREEHLESGRFTTGDNAGFLREMEEVLAILKKEYPQFLLSNKVRLFEAEEQLSNDAGTDLKFSDRAVSLALIVKHVDSVNVFDDALVMTVRDFDREAFLKEAREHLDAFLNPVQLPEEEKLAVIVNPMELAGFLIQNMDAQTFGRGTSFFNGKLGEKLFNEKFSLYVDRTAETLCNPFFDAEGSTCENDKCYIIKNGVLVRPFADKKLASEFGYENTATAEGSYDSVPSNNSYSFAGESSGKSLKELVGTGDAVYISTMSGGDFTGDGNFASPVQTAYLYRDGKLVGRLPEFNISGNLYDIFGQDFIGISDDRPYESSHLMAVRMNCKA